MIGHSAMCEVLLSVRLLTLKLTLMGFLEETDWERKEKRKFLKMA